MRIQNLVLAAAAAGAIGVVVQPAQADPCDTDVNGDGIVDVLDLLDVLTDWGPCPGCDTDVNGDDVVDVLDLLEILTDWGQTCGTVFQAELAGNPLTEYPFFEYVLAFNEGFEVNVALDPSRFPQIIGQTADIYIVEAKTEAGWLADQTLTDMTGGYQTETFVAGTIQNNTFVVSGADTLSADAGLSLGHPYDVVLDFNQDGKLNVGDFIDGRDDVVHGMYTVADLVPDGPLAVTEATYTCPNWDGTPNYGAQNTFYPTNIADMGKLPMIIVSHGNGHNYIWYDHIGFHMASHGYVVMSHRNNTGPGVFYASTTTLEHTDAFIRELPNIQGGVLDGHVDTHNIVWIGHSRGAEGVAIAWDRITDGAWTPIYYTLDDIKLVSSIAPTDFLGPYQTNPHDANYHLWTGSSDADVNGSASCNLCQTYHLHDRAEEYRQSITLQGVGHGDFHNGTGSSVATGPCLVGRSNTHKIVKGQFFPLCEHYVYGNVPAKDFLTRQYETFRPIGVPDKECIVVDMMYREGSAAGNFFIDDYESESSTSISSSGGAVSYTVANLWEGENDDQDTTFNHSTADEMNGTTLGGSADNFTHGVVFEWNSNAYYQFDIIPAEQDMTDDTYVSFRAAQATHHPNTIAVLGDLTFEVTLVDGNGTTSSISVGANGGGIEEPYQRSGGWHNEFETIRIRLTDFLNNASGLDLSDITNVRLDFGPAHGSNEGRLNLDTVEITKN